MAKRYLLNKNLKNQNLDLRCCAVRLLHGKIMALPLKNCVEAASLRRWTYFIPPALFVSSCSTTWNFAKFHTFLTVYLSPHPDRHSLDLTKPYGETLTDNFISSDETAFGDAKPIYDKALADSSFCEMTEFLEDRKSSSEKRKRKNRRRNITWFNPPYSQNVSTNIGRRFRTLISKHFPWNSELSKIFNIKTLKLSYSCMPNMAALISQHNRSILRGGTTIGENYAGEEAM